MSELFSEKKWIGEFFFQDDYENRFVGELCYSPEKGVVLSYSINHSKFPQHTNILHGIIKTGDKPQKCTLIGNFYPHEGGFFHGELYSVFGKAIFQYLLIGEFVEENDLFSKVYFSIPTLQEFFIPEMFSLGNASKNPSLDIKTDFGNIEICNIPVVQCEPNIVSRFFCEEEGVLEELKICLNSVRKKYPNSMFYVKKEAHHKIHLNITNGASIDEAYRYMKSILDLFAILTCSTAYPDDIRLKLGNRILDVYRSQFKNPRTIALSKSKRTHHLMPIQASNIDFGCVVKEWFEIKEEFSLVTSRVQNETNLYEEHSCYADIVVYATLLEAITIHDKEVGINVDVGRYEYPIESYANDDIKAKITEIIKKTGEEDIGKAVGDIRNEIAHTKKARQHINKLEFGDMIKLSILLKFTILGYTLRRLGIGKEKINSYQEQYLG